MANCEILEFHQGGDIKSNEKEAHTEIFMTWLKRTGEGFSRLHPGSWPHLQQMYPLKVL